MSNFLRTQGSRDGIILTPLINPEDLTPMNAVDDRRVVLYRWHGPSVDYFVCPIIPPRLPVAANPQPRFSIINTVI